MSHGIQQPIFGSASGQGQVSLICIFHFFLLLLLYLSETPVQIQTLHLFFDVSLYLVLTDDPSIFLFLTFSTVELE